MKKMAHQSCSRLWPNTLPAPSSVVQIAKVKMIRPRMEFCIGTFGFHADGSRERLFIREHRK
jgi:hypothetical protein